MLWNVVYEFFVKYVFGGVWGDDVYYEAFVGVQSTEEGLGLNIPTSSLYAIQFSNLSDEHYPYLMSLGNYLSLIATIISMVVIVVLACLFIKKIYNMVAHIIA